MGTGGRGTLSGPARVNTGIAVSKDIALREELKFQFRAEFSNPANNLTSGTLRAASRRADSPCADLLTARLSGQRGGRRPRHGTCGGFPAAPGAGRLR